MIITAEADYGLYYVLLRKITLKRTAYARGAPLNPSAGTLNNRFISPINTAAPWCLKCMLSHTFANSFVVFVIRMGPVRYNVKSHARLPDSCF